MRPECRSLTVIFTLDHVSPPGFTFLSFLTTLVATRRCRCLLRSAWVNIMPVRLLFVISGILAGGIPGFRIELLLLLSPDVAHWCVFVGSVCVLFWAILQDDTQDVIMRIDEFRTDWLQSCHCLFLAVSVLGWLVLVVCFLLCWFLVLVFVLCLMGLSTGLCIGPLPALLRLLTLMTALQVKCTIQLVCCG